MPGGRVASRVPSTQHRIMAWVSFTLIVATIALLGHLYLYRRLFRPVLPHGSARRAAGIALATLALSLLSRRPLRVLGSDIAQAQAIVAYTWLAVALWLLLATVLKDLTALVMAPFRGRKPVSKNHEPPTAQAARQVSGPDLSRRAMLARGVHHGLHVGALLGGSTAAAYGAFRAFAPAEISEVEVRLPRLSRSLDGMTLVHLSDIHVGPFIDAAFLDVLVERANAQRPDAVVITGDLVDGSVATLGPAVARLSRLRSRFGTYFVTGNHEYYSGHRAWCGFLEQLGITVLRNRSVRLGDGGAALNLAGVDDWSAGRRFPGSGYDLQTALAGRDPDRATVLLAHQPVNFEVAVDRGVGLQLSGHTHGGQVFPMTMLVQMRYPFCRGLYHHRDSHIYVSRGCGFWGPPSRIGSPPEIAALHLTV